MRATNEELIDLIRLLKRRHGEGDGRLWRAVAEKLERARSQRIEVNIGSIARSTSANDTILVPGKVLGYGTINHPVKVAAFKFSATAANAIAGAGGECFTIRQLMETNPAGSGIKMLG
jgi:large subunit ribosomal protein L18e